MATEQEDRILKIDIEKEMKQSYIDYSMSVIVARALPDVRDGFKPVHRRVLFGMNELGNTSNKPYKKSARIVGEVLGKYHPHGDSSVYFAMVRMGQDWSLRYPLVDGQGNYGSIDGDSPAAMRYTEARLSRIAEEMLRDIDKETVDFQKNFDDTLDEPVVLPTRIPNLLVNGASGIAVGMATNMPPHNLTETINGIIAYIDNREITIEELMQYIKAPDFPTGGYIYGYNGVKEAYETGRGRIVIRSKAEIETEGNREKIIVSEIPYGEGLIIACDHIDEVVQIIRSSKSPEEARTRLMERFSLTEIQASAIVDMRLRQLTGLMQDKLHEEYKNLMDQIDYFHKILSDEAVCMQVVKDELIEIRDKYGDERKTQIIYSSEEFNAEDFYADDEMIITISHLGYIKRTPLTEFRTQNS